MLKEDETTWLCQEERQDRMDSKEGTQILCCFQPEFSRLRSKAGLPVHSALNFKVQRKAGNQKEFQ